MSRDEWLPEYARGPAQLYAAQLYAAQLHAALAETSPRLLSSDPELCAVRRAGPERDREVKRRALRGP